jgi:hypothetical protein
MRQALCAVAVPDAAGRVADELEAAARPVS